jgi:hypothetical protein
MVASNLAKLVYMENIKRTPSREEISYILAFLTCKNRDNDISNRQCVVISNQAYTNMEFNNIDL